MAINRGNVSFSSFKDVEEWARRMVRLGPATDAQGDVTGPWTALAIAAGAVTVAKLAGAAQDLIYTHTVTSDTPKASPNDITTTIQVGDAAGNALAGRFLFRVRIGTADYGAPAAGYTFTAITAGTNIQTVVANQDYWFETDSTGKIVFTGNSAAPAVTLYIMASLVGKTLSTAEAWT